MIHKFENLSFSNLNITLSNMGHGSYQKKVAFDKTSPELFF